MRQMGDTCTTVTCTPRLRPSLKTSVAFVRLSAPRTAIHQRVACPRGAPLEAAAASAAGDAEPAPGAENVAGVEPAGEPGDTDPCEAEAVEPPPPVIGVPPGSGRDGVTRTGGVVAVGVETVGVRTVGVGTGVGGVVGTGAGGRGAGGRGAGGAGGSGGGNGGTVTDGTDTVGTETVGVGTDTCPSAAEAASPPS